MSQDISKFIAEVSVYFPLKHESPQSEAMWLRSMKRDLREYPASVLERAAKLIIDTRRRRDFPLPSECRDACKEVQKPANAASIARKAPEPGEDYVKTADLKARFFVNGSIRNEKTGEEEPRSAHWSAQFLAHETVKLAEAEGWGLDLACAVIYAARRRVMRGEDLGDISLLMPDDRWIQVTRQDAKLSRKAAEQRNLIYEQYGDMDTYLTKTVRGRTNRGTAKPIGGIMQSIVQTVTDEEEMPT